MADDAPLPHKWRLVERTDDDRTYRMKVPGGWLYQIIMGADDAPIMTAVFVPASVEADGRREAPATPSDVARDAAEAMNEATGLSTCHSGNGAELGAALRARGWAIVPAAER